MMIAVQTTIDPCRNEAFAQPAGGRPRILQFLPFAVRGGVEEHALSILAALPDYGFEPWIAAPSALLAQMAPELSAFGVRSFSVSRLSPLAIAEVFRFARFLRREGIAIVHSHMFPASLFASPVARLSGVRGVVETFHLREVWREDKLLKASFWLDRQVARFVDRYIAVSHAVERHLVENKRISQSKVTTIYNGRDLRRFRPRLAHERAHARRELAVTDAQVLLVLGRLEPQKGHAYLIEAMQGLVQHWPRLVALFAGTGSLQGELEKRCHAAGLGRKIRFLGQRNDSERLLTAADIVVLPSLYEGLPLVAIEALASGRPMVASDIEGTREIVIDGDTGILFPPADPTALAQGIQKLLVSPALAAELGARGRALVERNFDIGRQIAHTMCVYDQLIRRQSSPDPVGADLTAPASMDSQLN
jgi:glycosyltransferase involved in cell wall biosynthesis